MNQTRYLLLAAVALWAATAHAGNKLIVKGQRVAVAKSALVVSPDAEWNKMGARPGRNSETWTIDGDPLNDLTFYGGIAGGTTLFREVSKKLKPLPRYSATMLLTDIPGLFENSYRIALDTPLMTIDSVRPAVFLGQRGVFFTYSFTRMGDDVRRKGEASAAIVGGKLYMIAFEAPALHYFEAGAAAARQVVESARLSL